MNCSNPIEKIVQPNIKKMGGFVEIMTERLTGVHNLFPWLMTSTAEVIR